MTAILEARRLTKRFGPTQALAGIDAMRHPAQVRQLIGLAGQYAAMEPAMTGRENLEMVGRLFGLKHQRARAAATAVLDHRYGKCGC